jgi:hypothetical protein
MRRHAALDCRVSDRPGACELETILVPCPKSGVATSALRCVHCRAFVGWTLSTAGSSPQLVCRPEPDDEDTDR